MENNDTLTRAAKLTASKRLPRRDAEISDALIGDPVPVRSYQPGPGSYDGAELGKTCQRPGAYDAYALPSLYGTRRVLPRGVV